MGYDPEKYNRHSIRMKGYDYSLSGAYFVTIVAKNRKNILGWIERNQIRINEIGELVSYCWMRIPNNFDRTKLDEYVMMPNHLHGIIFIDEASGKGEAFGDAKKIEIEAASSNASPLRPKGTVPGSLGAIIQNFKSVSTRMANKRYFEPGNKIWQRDYYERIIRNERELNAIRQYIRDNPLNWDLDSENPMR